MKLTLSAAVVGQQPTTAVGATAGRLTSKLYVAHKCIELFFWQFPGI